jgi:hypothetical protein
MKHTPIALPLVMSGPDMFDSYDVRDANGTLLYETRSREDAKFIVTACNNYAWMRREIERVGDALFTNAKGEYTGTEEDLQCVGQTVEGVVETMLSLKERNEGLVQTLLNAYLQLEYLHSKFTKTGSGEAALARIREELAKEGK